jgi:integrase
MAQLIQFPVRQEQKAIATWVTEFEQDYFTRRARTSKSETTWDIDYKRVFARLPQSQPLTPDALMTLATSTNPDTRTRKRYCIALGALARFAGLTLDLKPYAGKYSPKTASPRELPDDSTIVRCHDQISADDWRWAYGMLAAYGLRPHELFHLDNQSLRAGNLMLKILDGGKTGARTVFPLYPEWIERFNLLDIRLPKCTGRTNKDLGNRVTHAFKRLVPFPAYALRHCWAIRSLEFGWEVAMAAQQMGHSVPIHTQTYHNWINERHQQKMFDALMQRSDRPTAPK